MFRLIMKNKEWKENLEREFNLDKDEIKLIRS
jgi:hypothetical protein